MPGGISLDVLRPGKKETTMQFDPAPLRAGFDWSFRPATYFLPDVPPPPEPLP